jgi:lactate dehydrogenase-like 2-hydroxyacid dehydrogenase
MATFKRFDNQQTYQLITEGAISANVGDVIAYDAAEKTIEVITSASAAAGKDLYMVAQSDAITYKNGTHYKTKILNNDNGSDTYDVNAASGKHIVVAYKIDNLENVEGLEA